MAMGIPEWKVTRCALPHSSYQEMVSIAPVVKIRAKHLSMSFCLTSVSNQAALFPESLPAVIIAGRGTSTRGFDLGPKISWSWVALILYRMALQEIQY